MPIWANDDQLYAPRHPDDDDNNDSLTYGSQEVSSHLTDQPGRGETHKTHQSNGREWTDHRHEPDGTSPEYIDLGVDHGLDFNSDDGEEV